MILIASKTIPNSDSLLQSINLEGSDIKHVNTVRNLGVCLDSTLSFRKAHSSICRISYMKIRQISAICDYLTKDVPHKTVVCVCSFKTRLLQLTFGRLS